MELRNYRILAKIFIVVTLLGCNVTKPTIESDITQVSIVNYNSNNILLGNSYILLKSIKQDTIKVYDIKRELKSYLIERFNNNPTILHEKVNRAHMEVPRVDINLINQENYMIKTNIGLTFLLIRDQKPLEERDLQIIQKFKFSLEDKPVLINDSLEWPRSTSNWLRRDSFKHVNKSLIKYFENNIKSTLTTNKSLGLSELGCLSKSLTSLSDSLVVAVFDSLNIIYKQIELFNFIDETLVTEINYCQNNFKLINQAFRLSISEFNDSMHLHENKFGIPTDANKSSSDTLVIPFIKWTAKGKGESFAMIANIPYSMVSRDNSKPRKVIHNSGNVMLGFSYDPINNEFNFDSTIVNSSNPIHDYIAQDIRNQLQDRLNEFITNPDSNDTWKRTNIWDNIRICYPGIEQMGMNNMDNRFFLMKLGEEIHAVKLEQNDR